VLREDHPKTNAVADLLQLTEYSLERLRDDGEFVLYRAHAKQIEPPSVLLLAPASTRPSPETLKKLDHEYSLRNELDSAWAVRPLALSERSEQMTLVLEDPGGESLDGFISGAMEMTQFLRFAVGLASALGGLHERKLIHKDVKPANVLVNSATGQVRLIGFGIASRLRREHQAPEPPEFIAGSLPYMAPEQTGRMNRSIDSRSDLYALGVTLYQMLTGDLPFSASDPLEWVHCHIARHPTPPSERVKSVPVCVSAIVMKLLAKTPEERYQTASGVESDLRRCLTEWEGHGCVTDFSPGQHDAPDRLLIPEKLYGREFEVDALLAAFDRVVTSGAPELVLVSGYSGIGKSSVVNELHKALVPPRGIFASGKFDQYKRDIPYSTLVQAFQSLVRPLLVKRDTELAKWRNALLEALEPNARLMTDLIPELRLIIGDQPPVPELEPQQAQSRFQLVFRRFIGIFAGPERPLALFVDDLQWLDTATLDLLEDLLTRSDLQHLMVIGAYRDNEVDAAHPLMRKLQAIKNAGGKVEEIALARLTREHLGQLIADSLYCEPTRVAPLAQLVHEKTAGNPFFVVQFLYSLAEEGLFHFDHDAVCWSWDLDRIYAKGYTDNVVDLMVSKLSRLPFETQQALQHLACLGNIAEISMLSTVLAIPEKQVHTALLEAVQQELVERLEGSYRFIHDRVQEAAYSLIPEAMRAEVHLRIGRLLVAQTPAEKREQAIFEIVNQLNRCAALITQQAERDQLAELNLIAGKRAMGSTAYASALTYLTIGMALLADGSWERLHEINFALELNRAECEFLTGQLAVAEERLAALSGRATTTVEQAIVACLHMDVCLVLDQSSRAIGVGLSCLRHFGIEWSAHPTDEDVRREYASIWSALGGKAIDDLIDLPLMADPESLATVDVLMKMWTPALYTDENLASLTICKAVSLSLERGNCDASTFAYVILIRIAGPRFGDYKAGFRFGELGYDLVARRGLKRLEARTYVCFALFVVPWMKHVRACRDLQLRAFEAANRVGDLQYAAYTRNDLNSNLIFAGESLSEAQAEAENGLAFTAKSGFGLGVDIIATQLSLIRTLRGLTPEFGCLDDEGFDEGRIERRFADNPDLAIAACWYWIRKLQARCIAGDHRTALNAAAKAQELLWTTASFFEEAEYHFYRALSHAACWDSALAHERQQHRDALALHHQQLMVWAENCPENFESRAALVGAEIARIEGRIFEAEPLYEQAIRSAHSNGFVNNEAIAYELAARFYAARGFQKFADAYWLEARYCYQRWGADGKIAQLDNLYPHLNKGSSSPTQASAIMAPTTLLDLATVIKVSQALSSEIVLPRVIEKIMRIAVEHAGAERGLLILLRGNLPQIEAEATTDGGRVEVAVRQSTITESDLPRSVVNYVTRTQEPVILDDASAESLYSEDEYVRQKRVRSVLCLPIIKQTVLIGALYLENNLTPCAFTAARVAVLELLASRAAVSLENARLYSDLQYSEAFLAEGQSISHTGSFGWSVSNGEIYWSEETYNIFEHDRSVKPTLDLIFQRIHPEDRDLVQQTLDHSIGAREDFDLEHRLLMPDNRIKHLRVLARALNTSSDNVEFVGIAMDVTEQKLTNEKLLIEIAERKRAEQSLKLQVDLLNYIPAVAWIALPNGAADFTSQQWHDYSGQTLDYVRSSPEAWMNALHPDDIEHASGCYWRGVRSEREFAFEARFRRASDGAYRWHLNRAAPLRDSQGNLIHFVGTCTDIEDLKQAEEARRESDASIRLIVDGIAGLVVISNREGEIEFLNKKALEYFGRTLEELKEWATSDVVHPDDLPHFVAAWRDSVETGNPFEIDHRLRRADGAYRWFHSRGLSPRDRQDRIIRWYHLLTDIDDRVKAEEKLRSENVALREEVDKASMFEQIVGTSPPLRKVLSRISKVAPTDSTVLVTGETGTGKELVARAIHRRSRRSPRAFVSVNCASIPRELIASELFGHEKGAFTGATQRRLGRFELAEGGTIFLDEVGELPPETQIALLRVLQEREFERIGATGSIRTNVRVIAATNRDLEAAITAGTFRSDLFYRLNVFPIEMPSLRERKEDIPLLVDYFIDRLARQAGKRFEGLNKKSLDLLQSYPWPGNIRELQNIIERSVIVCETENFSVDESWLSRQPPVPVPRGGLEPFRKLPSEEKEIIEAALRESGGRVYGPSGAATKLGIPRSTLEHKIRSLKINKNRFKTADSSSND
jgi:PAS domain S-box-containing protein